MDGRLAVAQPASQRVSGLRHVCHRAWTGGYPGAAARGRLIPFGGSAGRARTPPGVRVARSSARICDCETRDLVLQSHHEVGLGIPGRQGALAQAGALSFYGNIFNPCTQPGPL
jgi:hypothetical protein